MFSGSIPALVTPFRDGAFDASAYARLVNWQIDEGTSALVSLHVPPSAAWDIACMRTIELFENMLYSIIGHPNAFIFDWLVGVWLGSIAQV